MLKATKEKLEDAIVGILSDHAAIAADELHLELKRRKLSYTIQALYKELRKLQQLGVVVKGRGLYSLRLSWILSLTDLADRAYTKYVDSPFPRELLPDSEKRMRWAFTSMLRADDFYMQVLTKLLMSPSAQSAYTAMEYPWFLFPHIHHELNHQRILDRQHRTQYVVLETDTPLVRAQVRVYDDMHVKCAFSSSPGMCGTYSIVTAIGDFILSQKLPAAARKGFAGLYARTRSLKDLNPKAISSLCNTAGTSAVVLERNPEKSKSITGKLEGFF